MVRSARNEMCEMRRKRDCHIEQLAKINWIKFGEETSSIFFNSVKARRGNNCIKMMRDESGLMHEDGDSIKQIILDFYIKLFGTEKACNIPNFCGLKDNGLSMEERCGLAVIPCEKEIFNAISGIGNNKSPGPDGFNSLFFKDQWKIVKEDVVNAVREFFVSGKLQIGRASCRERV